MARKTIDPKAKAKKQKIILGAGAVILLGLLAYQLPKIMKGSSPPSAVPAVTTTTAASGAVTPAPATPVASGSTSTPLNAELTFSKSVSKIASLSSFPAKDPFKALISTVTAASSPTTTPAASAVPPAPAATTPATGPLFGTVDGSAAGASGSSGSKSKAAGKAAGLPSATIVFNGKRLNVKLGEAFPKSNPVFRLAGIQSGNLLVALVKGGLADGSAVITLPTRHPVTLVNTVDNTRYTLVFLTGKKKKGA